MTRYFKVMLGSKSSHAAECIAGNFIGADFGEDEDLKSRLTEDYREFNKEFIPQYLARNPDKSRVGAGLSGGQLWVIAKGISVGDLVLCPSGSGTLVVGEVTSDYTHAPGEILPHRRAVTWVAQDLDRSSMSDELKGGMGYGGTVCELTKHGEEIEVLIGRSRPPQIISTDESVEDASSFVLEEHLEAFLIANWERTDLGREYDLYRVDGEIVGEQFQTDTGPLDILAISKDEKRLLVIELKKGRASDAVVGQILRYMSYVQDVCADSDQIVEGAIIALKDDPKVRRALSMTPSIRFYRYRVSFSLEAS
jgi:restriction system protein